MSKLALWVVWTFPFTPSLVAAQSTVLLSVDSSGNQGSVASSDAVTSVDGRYTAFVSRHAFVVTDTNSIEDIYRRDRLSGQTVLVSISNGGTAGAGFSYSPAITPNGRFITFSSNAADLVSGDTGGNYDVFLRDMVAGTTELVSKSSAGVLGDFDSSPSQISDDARYIAFCSGATNLVAGDTNADYDVFLRDRTLGTTIRVSVSSTGTQANGASGTQLRALRISGNGRYVCFTSTATNLVPVDSNGIIRDGFIRDLQLGTTALASLNSFGVQGNSTTLDLAVSYDGRYLAFGSLATNMVPNDTNGDWDVFVRDLQTGYTSIASVSSTGAYANAGATIVSMSADGRYVAFGSNATNLSPLAPTLHTLYVRDRATGLTTLESPNQAGNPANNHCQMAAISGSGRFVVFQSAATDLVAVDTNGQADIFQRDRGALPAYSSYCFGDGFGASCPCANESQYGFQEGCKYALGLGGKLTATGNPDVMNDTFVLRGSQLGSSACLYFQGTATINNGLGIPFGDGLLCVGGTIVRLAVKFNVLGVSQYPDTGDLPLTGASVIPIGATRTYQIWFRDAIPFCTIATYNMTNGIEVVWSPCPNC